MLLALHAPRLPLAIALARTPVPAGTPVALGPEPFGEPRVGTPSAAAEAAGVRAGMPLGEALTLCPGLALVAPDPSGVRAWARDLLAGIDALGLPVEEIGPGRVLIDAAPGLRLHGGPRGLVRRLAALDPDSGLQIGAAPARFAALMAARMARRRPRILAAGDLAEALGPLPVRLLHEDGDVPLPVCRALALVGIDRLAGVASLSRLAVRDRFGEDGLRAWRMARGEDGDRLAPVAVEAPIASILRPDAPIATDQALVHALDLLLERALADPARGDRAPRLLELEARLITGESWCAEVPLREATVEHRRLCEALLPKARRLPAPAERLRLVLAALTPGTRQLTLLVRDGQERDDRIAEAARQVRDAVGEEALLRIVPIDPASRLPERRYGLAPR